MRRVQRKELLRVGVSMEMTCSFPSRCRPMALASLNATVRVCGPPGATVPCRRPLFYEHWPGHAAGRLPLCRQLAAGLTWAPWQPGARRRAGGGAGPLATSDPPVPHAAVGRWRGFRFHWQPRRAAAKATGRPVLSWRRPHNGAETHRIQS